MKRINNTLVWIIFVGVILTTASQMAYALPPDPDNAALLYYQGFLSLPQLNQEERDHIREVTRGNVAPDDKVREYIAQSKGAIHFVEAAVKVPDCQWGVQFSEGFDALMPQMAQIRFMTFMLIADARVRAADGDYRGALERCLMTETFAYHIGNDTMISYLVSIAVRAAAYKCIQAVVGQAADDAELLQWLKNELAKSPINTLTAARPLKYEIEIFTDLMRIENVEQMAGVMMGELYREKANEIIKTTNAEILEQAKRIYSERMNSALTVLSTSMPYEQAYSQLKKLEDNLDPNDPASSIAGAFIPSIARILTLKTRTETHANAIKAGVEILHNHAQTGRLADTLPAGLPKDAFSGKDFKYEKTKAGFILHCPDKDLNKDEINQYEFKLSK